MSQLLFLDNQFHRAGQPLISVDNRSFRYGDGLFETLRCKTENIQLADFHFDRLFSGMQLLGFEPPSFFTRNYLAEKVQQLLHRNGHSQLARVRLTVFRGDGGPFDAVSGYPHLLIQSWALSAGTKKINENGLVLGIHQLTKKPIDQLANCKTNNYLSPLMAARAAKKNHWNDAVILNTADRVCETTIANIFLFNNDLLITPALTEAPVAGTMRRHILQQARHLQIPIEERAVTVAELLEAEEVFICNAIQGIRWVASLENKNFVHSKTSALFQQLITPLWQ